MKPKCRWYHATPRKISPFKPKQRLMLTKDEIKSKQCIYDNIAREQALHLKQRQTADVPKSKGGPQCFCT